MVRHAIREVVVENKRRPTVLVIPNVYGPNFVEGVLAFGHPDATQLVDESVPVGCSLPDKDVALERHEQLQQRGNPIELRFAGPVVMAL